MRLDRLVDPILVLLAGFLMGPENPGREEPARVAGL